MIVYLVDYTTRKNDRDGTLGPFATFEKARDAARREYLDHWTDEELNEYKEYGSEWSEGNIFTEEYSVEIFERELEL